MPLPKQKCSNKIFPVNLNCFSKMDYFCHPFYLITTGFDVSSVNVPAVKILYIYLKL